MRERLFETWIKSHVGFFFPGYYRMRLVLFNEGTYINYVTLGGRKGGGQRFDTNLFENIEICRVLRYMGRWGGGRRSEKLKNHVR